jgi:hypothetical protein
MATSAAASCASSSELLEDDVNHEPEEEEEEDEDDCMAYAAARLRAPWVFLNFARIVSVAPARLQGASPCAKRRSLLLGCSHVPLQRAREQRRGLLALRAARVQQPAQRVAACVSASARCTPAAAAFTVAAAALKKTQRDGKTECAGKWSLCRACAVLRSIAGVIVALPPFCTRIGARRGRRSPLQPQPCA